MLPQLYGKYRGTLSRGKLTVSEDVMKNTDLLNRPNRCAITHWYGVSLLWTIVCSSPKTNKLTWGATIKLKQIKHQPGICWEETSRGVLYGCWGPGANQRARRSLLLRLLVYNRADECHGLRPLWGSACGQTPKVGKLNSLRGPVQLRKSSYSRVHNHTY